MILKKVSRAFDSELYTFIGSGGHEFYPILALCFQDFEDDQANDRLGQTSFSKKISGLLISSGRHATEGLSFRLSKALSYINFKLFSDESWHPQTTTVQNSGRPQVDLSLAWKEGDFDLVLSQIGT